MSSERTPVAFITGEFPKASETFLLRELRELARRGLDFVIVATGRLPDIPEAEGLADRVILRPPYLSLRSLCGEVCFALTHPLRYLDVTFKLLGGHWRNLRELLQVFANLPRAMAVGYALRRRGVRRVHALWANFPATLGWMIARGLRMEFSFSAHAWDVYVGGRMLREKTRLADRVFACSRSAADHLKTRLSPRRARKVALLHHGIDFGNLPKRPETPENRILAAGRFEPKKGFDVLIEACRQLMRRGRQVPSTRVGDGSLRARLVRAAAGLPVTIVPWKPHAELMVQVASAGVVATPSVVAPDGDRDGIPNIVLEAMAMGVPVVGTNVGGIGEVIRDGETGYLVEPGDAKALADALLRIFDEPEKTNEMTVNARETVRREFALDETASTLMRFLAGS